MTTRLRFDRFEVHPIERRLLCDGAPVRLGARAFDLLLALVGGRGRVVTKDELLEAVWPGLVVEEANVQVQMSALRKVLGPHAVATIPGLGYRFAAAVEASPAEPGSAPSAAVPEAARASSNLSAVIDRLIGRDDELEALIGMLERHRLVTVAGAGGIGKTRLAQAAARAVLDRHPRGVWWVELSSLGDAGPLALAIAKAAGVPLGSDDGVAGLVRALAGQRMLLVLDNCEHLVAPVAALVRSLLDHAGGVAVLATSQEPLKLVGECVLALGPLQLPRPGATLEQARGSPALQLFETRAAAVDRRFALTEANVAQVGELCRRLDGLALAIEMAAARAPLLGLELLGRQLGERLDRLHAAPRDVPSRHRTLRQTLDWSHALLGADEAAVLRRLSAFAGSFRLEAAQATAADGTLDGWAVADALEGLVGKSLVKLEQVDPPRYRLLETTRVYAREQLARAGEVDATRRRYVDAMARVADAADTLTVDIPWHDCLPPYLPDYDDFEQAFAQACELAAADAAAALVTTMRVLDLCRGLYLNAGRRAPQAAGLVAAAGPRARARLLHYIATIGWVEVPGWTRIDSAREAVRLWRALGDTRLLYSALGVLANCSSQVGDHAAAEAALAEAQQLERADWPPRRRALRMIHDGWVAQDRGDMARACDSMREAVALFERDGEVESASTLRVELAAALLRAGRHAESVSCAETAVAEWRVRGQVEQLGTALVTLGKAASMAGDAARAKAAVLQALAMADEVFHSCGDLLTVVAALAATDDGNAAAAGQLLGYLDANEPEATVDASAASLRRRARDAIDQALDPAQRQQALDGGARLDRPAALRLARLALRAPP